MLVQFLLPVLYLVTRRHLQIMRLARTVILVDRELESATQTIANILEAVDLRVEELAGALQSSLL
jgi:ABC-type molybdate transport system ATPase subunit